MYSYKCEYFIYVNIHLLNYLLLVLRTYLKFNFVHTPILDCRTSARPGYNFNYTDTTYEATASVECATGYEGTPNPGNVACLDTGNWTAVTGCNRKGMMKLAIHAFNISLTFT